MLTATTLEELSKDRNFNDLRHPLIHVDFHVSERLSESDADRVQSDAYQKLLVKTYESWSNPFRYKVVKLEWKNEAGTENSKLFKLIAIRVDDPVPFRESRNLEEITT